VIQAVVHKCHGGVSQPFFQAVKSHVRFDAKCLRFPNWLVGVVRLTIDIIVATQVLEPPVCMDSREEEGGKRGLIFEFLGFRTEDNYSFLCHPIPGNL